MYDMDSKKEKEPSGQAGEIGKGKKLYWKRIE
jgi:hypothetical protein